MASKKIFVGDIGVTFRVYAGIDISNATSIVMRVKKPNSALVAWTATVAEDNNYYAVYKTVEDDLDLEGDWLLSLEVTTPTIDLIKGESAEFKVYTQFEDNYTCD